MIFLFLLLLCFMMRGMDELPSDLTSSEVFDVTSSTILDHIDDGDDIINQETVKPPTPIVPPKKDHPSLRQLRIIKMDDEKAILQLTTIKMRKEKK